MQGREGERERKRERESERGTERGWWWINTQTERETDKQRDRREIDSIV